VAVKTLEPHLVSNLQNRSCRPCRVDDLITLRDGKTEWLFTEDVFPRLQSSDRRGVMLIIRQSHNDGIHAIVTGNFFPTMKSEEIIPDQRFSRFEAFIAPAANRRHLNSVNRQKISQMRFSSKPTCS
jgi:hypothetical protein